MDEKEYRRKVNLKLYIVWFDNDEDYEDLNWDFMIVKAKSPQEAKDKIRLIINIESELDRKDCRDEKGIGVWQIIPTGYFHGGKVTKILLLEDYIKDCKALISKARKLKRKYLDKGVATIAKDKDERMD